MCGSSCVRNEKANLKKKMPGAGLGLAPLQPDFHRRDRVNGPAGSRMQGKVY